MTTREVVLDGGSPWGFRLHGGADVNQPLRISRVNPGSKAAFRGVREGDIITSINGHSTKEISNAEAHAFLRNSGDTLKLGLNEEYSGSPKRRQYRTVQHQETHSETCKKSSITSYTLSSSKTVSQTEVINDPASKVNGNATTVNGESTNDPPSTLSSNSSTPSTITETGSSHQEDAMPDNASRSRRKRSRNQRKKNNKNGGKQVANEPSESEYRVDSPTGEKKKMPGKSKSLDDDEIVKIQELSEVSSSEEKIDENKGVVSEVESEPESQEVLISPEEEKTLRNFLEGLNLVNSPEDAAKQVFDNVDVKTRRAKKKAVLEQYFAPLAQNPRYLDVINEENSDLSDREQQPHHLKQGTPELEIVDRGVVWQKKMQAHYCAPISPILVGVKFFEPPVATQAICTNAPTPNPVEKVFIEDSDSSSPEFFEATSSNSSVPELNQEKEVVEETRRMEIFVEKNRANSRNVDQEIVGKSQQIHILVRKNDSVIKTDSAEILSQLTPPPTPDDMSPKGEAVDTTLIQTAEDVRIKLENCVKDEEEVEKICRNINKTIYTNVISPPAPSRSPSLSSDNSSRSSSLVTAKYNPNSSVADIESIRQEIDKIEVQPSTLRELCLNYLISQPFGAEVLQELAEVSLTLENLTSNLSDPKTCELPGRNEWVGVATEDSKVLLCLSPSQKEELEKSRKMDNEGGKLLELHEKFLSRTFCESKNEVVITSIKDDAKLSGNNGNRLLAIIREDPSASESKPEEFYVEKKGKGATLPRRINMDSARLKAKDLTEWLQLARRKSTSESNLTALRDTNSRTRRTSLPQEFYQEQMHYLLEKEREIQRELEFLEEEKRKLSAEMAPSRQFHPEDYHISRQGDYAECKRSRPTSMPVASEFFRQQMYEEYLDKFAAHEDRKQHKVIKVTTPPRHSENKSMTGLEEEFMDKVKQKQKLGKLNREDGEGDSDVEPVKGVRKLPKHLQEFVDITKLAENSPRDGVWTPGQKQEFNLPEVPARRQRDEPVIPVWTPKSATSSPIAERKEFKPVKFESPVLGRKQFSRTESQESSESSKEPPWKLPETSSDTGIVLSTTLQKRLPTSHSSPGFNNFSTTRLPRAQNPTITLLQKAREGQLPKGALYIDQEQSHKRPHNERTPFVTPVYEIKHEYTSESDSERPRKMADLGPRKFPGVGPTTKDGMPLILRSEVKDANQSKWYKKMYDTIHKQKPHRDEFVTVKYRHPRGQFPYASGYLSEPEPGAYDSDYTDYKYATLDRRRAPNKENEYTMSSTIPRTTAPQEIVKYPNEGPRRIENYTTGHSSISDKEAKEWWDEVMDIFDGQFEQQKRPPLQPQPPPPHAHPKSFINQALKESGYESDSTLIFRKRDDLAQQLSPLEQKEAYKFVQQGGDIPLHGFRKPAPERPKGVEPEPPAPPPKSHYGLRNHQPESPRKYLENEVTIHYKTPVRQEIKEYLSEDELAHRQAEAMKKIYQEERRRKYLQELQDMNNRRHTDNFIPSQKSPISLNRYDDFDDLAPPVKPRPRSPEPRLMARALYNFVGQTARELTFRKGDLIYVRRQVDKNWYEGELNAMVGLFPVNYVEIVPHDTSKSTVRKPHEGQARAKYNFVAQTHLELSLAKGELVVVTRKVDDNWFEGKIGGRKGIFPVSYVEILIDPNDPPPPSTKPVASPAAHSLLLNGSAGGKESMGSHSYTPHASGNQLTSSRYHAKPVQITNSGSYGSLNSKGSTISPVNQALHIETQSEPVPYRALYKYVPQNDDELELFEGDTVYVLEKCDDGWYVGSSDRTGAFGTFPGNYVEKI